MDKVSARRVVDNIQQGLDDIARAQSKIEYAKSILKQGEEELAKAVKALTAAKLDIVPHAQ